MNVRNHRSLDDCLPPTLHDDESDYLSDLECCVQSSFCTMSGEKKRRPTVKGFDDRRFDDRPLDRPSKLPFQDLKEVPLPSYFMKKGYTLADLAQIFTLIAAADADTALNFLAEVHYFFLVKRDGDDKESHFKVLLADRSQETDFFFAVKCIIRGHSISTVHMAVVNLLAMMSFITEKNFGDRVDSELSVMFTSENSLGNPIGEAIRNIILPGILVPTDRSFCPLDHNDNFREALFSGNPSPESIKKLKDEREVIRKFDESQAASDPNTFDKREADIDMQFCRKLVVLIMLIDDKLRGQDLWRFFNYRLFAQACVRIISGKSKADKEMTKNRQLVLRFMSIVAREPSVCQMFQDMSVHKELVKIYKERVADMALVPKDKQTPCDALEEKTVVVSCYECILYEFFGTMCSHSSTVSLYVSSKLERMRMSAFETCYQLAREFYKLIDPKKDLIDCFFKSADLSELQPEFTSKMRVPHLSALIHCVGGMLVNNPKLFVSFIMEDMNGNADLARVANWLRCLFFCACVDNESFGRVGGTGIQLLLVTLKSKSLGKLTKLIYQQLDSKLLLQSIQELSKRYNFVKKRRSDAALLPADFEVLSRQLTNIARRLVSMMDCLAMYNHDPEMSEALNVNGRETYVLAIFREVDDDGVKFAVAKVLESVPITQLSPDEMSNFMENMDLPRTTPVINRVLASFMYAVYKMAVVAFDDDQPVAASDERWRFASDFRTEYFPKMLAKAVNQLKMVAVEQTSEAGKMLYEQALIKFLELTFQFPETRHILLKIPQYIIYPSLFQLFMLQQRAGDMVDDRSFYPEISLAGWNIDFLVKGLPKFQGRSRFRALHQIADVLMGIHRQDTSQRLRTLARKSPLDGTDWHKCNISFTIDELLNFEAEMWPFDPFAFTSTGLPPQQQRVPCSWHLEEPDVFEASADDNIERDNLAHELSSLHIAAYRAIFQGTRTDLSHAARKQQWRKWIDSIAEQEGKMTWLSLTDPAKDSEWALNKSKKRVDDGEDEKKDEDDEVDVGNEEDDDAPSMGKKKRSAVAIDDVAPLADGEDDPEVIDKYRKALARKAMLEERQKKLMTERRRRVRMRGILAHEPWTAEEELRLKAMVEAAKNDTIAKQREAMIRSTNAHLVQIFEESYILPQGPSKMFVLRAEGDLAGFVVGGPPLTDAFSEDTVEIYALHVLPTYAHFAEFYLMLWRAFALWAQRVTWKTEDDNQAEVKRYNKGTIFIAEHHPAVVRFFCKHPIMELSDDHPEMDTMEQMSLPHRCYTWDCEKVRRVEPWEVSQTEHASCVMQFVKENGINHIWTLLRESSGWMPEDFKSDIGDQMEDFGQRLWNSPKPVELESKLDSKKNRYHGLNSNFWDVLTEDYVRPETGPTKPNIVPSLLFAVPNSEFDFMMTAARNQHNSRFTYVNFYDSKKKSPVGSSPSGVIMKPTPMAILKNKERLASLAAILRILYSLLRYNHADIRELILGDDGAENGLLNPAIMHLLLTACAKENFGLTADETNQKFAIPFKLLSIIEELIHVPPRSYEDAKRMIALCDVILGAISRMMRGTIDLLQKRVDSNRSGLVSSDHPSQSCRAKKYNPFTTNPFSSPVSCCTPEVMSGKTSSFVGADICTCLMCAMRYMTSVAAQISHVVSNLNFFEYIGASALEEEHYHGYELDTRFMANVMCRRHAQRLLFKPAFLRLVMDFLEIDIKLSSGLFAVDQFDPLSEFQSARLAALSRQSKSDDDAGQDDDDDFQFAGRKEPKLPYLTNMTSALAMRNDACSIWADYLKVYPKDKFQQFLEYNYALCGPDGDRALALRASFMGQLLTQVNRVNVGTRCWFERMQIRTMQKAMFRRELHINKLFEEHAAIHRQTLLEDGLSPEEADANPPPPLVLTEEEEDELPPIPPEEIILAMAFVDVYSTGWMSSGVQQRLLICTNYNYYVSKQPVDMSALDSSGYSTARIFKAFADRIAYRRTTFVERMERLGEEADEEFEFDDDGQFGKATDPNDSDTIPYRDLTTEQRWIRDLKEERNDMPFTADEMAGYSLAGQLEQLLECRSYERVFQVVRGFNDEMIMIQRFPDSGDTEVVTDVFWTGSMGLTERLLFAFAKNCHQWDPSPKSTIWSQHLPAPMAISPDFFTATQLKRLFKQEDGMDDATLIQYSACGLVYKPLSQEKSPHGSRQRTVMVIVDKEGGSSGGGGNPDSITIPGSSVDMLFLHEHFYNWGNFASAYFVEPPALIKWGVQDITMLKPMPATMEQRLTKHFADVDWYASTIPSTAKFSMLTEKFAVRLDFPDELMREYTQRVISRYLLAKAAAQ